VKCPRTPRIDYTREFFCRRWKDNFDCLCPPKCDYVPNCSRGLPDEMDSLDYYSIPPLMPAGYYPGVKGKLTMAQKYGLVRKGEDQD
jgi:hypothetical protein